MLVNCYDDKSGVSLSEEARTKDNEADNVEDRIYPRALSGFKESLSEELFTQESVLDPNAMKRTAKLQ